MDGGVALHALNVVYELATLALTTLGLAVVFGLLGVMNMAHGEFVMIGAYSVVAVQQWGWPIAAAFPLAVGTCAALGWVVERWPMLASAASKSFGLSGVGGASARVVSSGVSAQ